MADMVNIHEAKTHLSKLLQRVIGGEEILIAKSGEPIAKIVPFKESPKPRVPGSAKGKVWIAPDFNDPLPDDVLNAFEGADSKG